MAPPTGSSADHRHPFAPGTSQHAADATADPSASGRLALCVVWHAPNRPPPHLLTRSLTQHGGTVRLVDSPFRALAAALRPRAVVAPSARDRAASARAVVFILAEPERLPMAAGVLAQLAHRASHITPWAFRSEPKPVLRPIAASDLVSPSTTTPSPAASAIPPAPAPSTPTPPSSPQKSAPLAPLSKPDPARPAPLVEPRPAPTLRPVVRPLAWPPVSTGPSHATPAPPGNPPSRGNAPSRGNTPAGRPRLRLIDDHPLNPAGMLVRRREPPVPIPPPASAPTPAPSPTSPAPPPTPAGQPASSNAAPSPSVSSPSLRPAAPSPASPAELVTADELAMLLGDWDNPPNHNNNNNNNNTPNPPSGPSLPPPTIRRL